MTGDWTQRARHSQFKLAAEFIKNLRVPIVSVPGNHDIPLYNLLKRMISPFKRYKKYIEPLTLAKFSSPECVIVGIRTPTAMRAVEGRIMSKDIARVEDAFDQASSRAVRIIACHHPLYEKKNLAKVVPAKRVHQLLHERPDLVLSGHSHLFGLDMLEQEDGHKTLHLSAGSATSNRLRGEVNSFHVLEIEDLNVTIETFYLEEEGFQIPVSAQVQKFSFFPRAQIANQARVKDT